jgi:hypothetical protein
MKTASYIMAFLFILAYALVIVFCFMGPDIEAKSCSSGQIDKCDVNGCITHRQGDY